MLETNTTVLEKEEKKQIIVDLQQVAENISVYLGKPIPELVDNSLLAVVDKFENSVILIGFQLLSNLTQEAPNTIKSLIVEDFYVSAQNIYWEIEKIILEVYNVTFKKKYEFQQTLYHESLLKTLYLSSAIIAKIYEPKKKKSMKQKAPDKIYTGSLYKTELLPEHKEVADKSNMLFREYGIKHKFIYITLGDDVVATYSVVDHSCIEQFKKFVTDHNSKALEVFDFSSDVFIKDPPEIKLTVRLTWSLPYEKLDVQTQLFAPGGKTDQISETLHNSFCLMPYPQVRGYYDVEENGEYVYHCKNPSLMFFLQMYPHLMSQYDFFKTRHADTDPGQWTCSLNFETMRFKMYYYPKDEDDSSLAKYGYATVSMMLVNNEPVYNYHTGYIL